MANWSEIPKDLLELISEKITCISDRIRFSGVCPSWRSAALQQRCHLPPQLPGLMIPGSRRYDSQTRRFLVFPERKLDDQEKKNLHQLPLLSVPHEDLCRGSNQGWLVMVNNDMGMYLLNPFCKARFELPPVTALPQPRPSYSTISKWYVHWAALSSIPSSGSTSECRVLIYYLSQQLAFCRPGDKDLSFFVTAERRMYSGAIYYKEKFHVIDAYGKVFICDIDASVPTITEFPWQPKVSEVVQEWYLVEMGGELLRVCRKVALNNQKFYDSSADGSDEDDDDNNNYDISIHVRQYTYMTYRFKICKLDSSNKKWVPVVDLGEYALFLGFNNSVALSVLDAPGIKANHIYFTDDRVIAHHLFDQSGYDMGIFNLEDSTMEQLYMMDSELTRPPAVWVTPIPW